jgi:hypothetical protein
MTWTKIREDALMFSDCKEGEDYVYFGYTTGQETNVTLLANNIRAVYISDKRNIPTDQIHLMISLNDAMRSRRELDKFTTAKLTPVKRSTVDAPYVEEFPVVLECSVREIFELGLHTQFVGEVMDVMVEEGVLNENGAIDIEKVRLIIFNANASI